MATASATGDIFTGGCNRSYTYCGRNSIMISFIFNRNLEVSFLAAETFTILTTLRSLHNYITC